MNNLRTVEMNILDESMAQFSDFKLEGPAQVCMSIVFYLFSLSKHKNKFASVEFSLFLNENGVEKPPI